MDRELTATSGRFCGVSPSSPHIVPTFPTLTPYTVHALA